MTTHMFTICLNAREHACCHQMPEHMWKWTLLLLPQVESCCWHIHEQARGHHTAEHVRTWVFPIHTSTHVNTSCHQMAPHMWTRVAATYVIRHVAATKLHTRPHVASIGWMCVNMSEHACCCQTPKNTWNCVLSQHACSDVSTPGMLSTNTWKYAKTHLVATHVNTHVIIKALKS